MSPIPFSGQRTRLRAGDLDDGHAVRRVHAAMNDRGFALRALEQVLLEGEEGVLREALVVRHALVGDRRQLASELFVQVDCHLSISALKVPLTQTKTKTVGSGHASKAAFPWLVPLLHRIGASLRVDLQVKFDVPARLRDFLLDDLGNFRDRQGLIGIAQALDF